MPIKKRTIAGGLLVVGAVLGTFMSGLLPGFGSGNGIGAQASGNSNTSANLNTRNKTPDVAASVEQQTTQKPEAAAPPTSLSIRVDNHDYFVTDNESATGLRKVGLDEAVQLAQTTTGNDDGIRVRIARSQSARVTAWTTLHDSLVKAGLTQDSIRMPKDLVE